MRILLTLLFAVWPRAFAQTLPTLSSPVVDEVGLLDPREQREIEKLIRDYHKSGKAQIQVAIVKDLQGLPVEEYSIRLVEKWQLGTSKKDNGVLFLIAPKDRRMRIEVGQGLEGALTDAYSRRILDDQVAPLFRMQHYGEGVLAGVLGIIGYVDRDYLDQHPQTFEPTSPKPTKKSFLFILFLFLFIVFSILRRAHGLPFGGRHYGGWGGFGGGLGGGSFGGGGGWSGGGGGFSGGGASSGW